MRKSKPSLQELKLQMNALKEQIDLKEQEINVEIGAWVRQQTGLDSLSDIQEKFQIVPIQNNIPKTSINTQTLSAIAG